MPSPWFAEAVEEVIFAASLRTSIPTVPLPNAIDFVTDTDALLVKMPSKAFPEAVDDWILAPLPPPTMMPDAPFPRADDDFTEAEEPSIQIPELTLPDATTLETVTPSPEAATP